MYIQRDPKDFREGSCESTAWGQAWQVALGHGSVTIFIVGLSVWRYQKQARERRLRRLTRTRFVEY